ncbi:hypothetical protein [Legionella cardiaca]|uniref:Uncharacterized protein n=1 Tax=Legionella cardiaca TaxID=1071983 RepID=A0ABY8AUC8_9GAMM|nr:hypothetical protein [Legionella cardiaca]WED44039.1 hypothetical protein PXX05_04430 [Legionella cardiaca]
MDANNTSIADILSRINYLSENINTFITLGITILAELFAFFVFIKRFVPKNYTMSWILFIVGINFLTNPLAQLFYSSLKLSNLAGLYWLLTEILVVLVEASLIYALMRQSLQKSLLYSFLLNITSIIVGAILCWLSLLPWCY